ncbi:hypothetical protein PILCRDRAFT_6923 [Piloderma croceum F 1598]|uniref:Phosphoglycerate mutase n=1 Tax=Piloderma croceum (strain F 1598) TaxID=765440 RepID=A0A0C3BB15_PILCF|nr:hypothetical protein PILCRDRAFT_6923 [Piloderma croceum F 1598]
MGTREYQVYNPIDIPKSLETDYQQAVPGFFEHDDPQRPLDALPPRFGLLDESADRWATFTSKIVKLNQEAPNGTHFKVFFLGRHGQGHHNVAENKYGTKAWDDYWSKLNGDGELVWGPDPDLTDVGIRQAKEAHAAWEAERKLEVGIPLPEKLYCSPMTRAMHTHIITFDGIITVENQKTLILENCREEYGEHTCDKRRSRTVIHSEFPQLEIEDGFTEEDELWTPERESEEHIITRAKAILDRVFDADAGQFISITAHGGIINAILMAVGRRKYALPTGGVLPIVIKVTNRVV